MHATPTAGQVLRDEGIALVTANSPADYKTAAITAIDALIATMQPFTADDVYALIPVELSPHSPNVVPALLGSRAKHGQIVSEGYVKTPRPSRHASKNQIWRAA